MHCAFIYFCEIYSHFLPPFGRIHYWLPNQNNHLPYQCQLKICGRSTLLLRGSGCTFRCYVPIFLIFFIALPTLGLNRDLNRAKEGGN